MLNVFTFMDFISSHHGFRHMKEEKLKMSLSLDVYMRWPEVKHTVNVQDNV